MSCGINCVDDKNDSEEERAPLYLPRGPQSLVTPLSMEEFQLSEGGSRILSACRYIYNTK